MICKNADSKAEAIATLQGLLAHASGDKKPLIERELRMLRAGVKGEQEAAYLIDFQLKDTEKTAVIHDLRVQLGDGRVAQIDHLLIHRTLRFYILETKHFSHGVKITDEGEFLRWNDWKKTYEGMASPIEQNERHAAVLRTLLSELGLGEPKIESMILIAPQARIDRPKRFNSDRVVKADQFLTAMQRNLDNTNIFSLLGGFAKVTFSETIDDIAKKLIRLHQPITVDYVAKFGLAGMSRIPNAASLAATQFGHSAHRPAAVTVALVPPAVSSGSTAAQCGYSPPPARVAEGGLQTLPVAPAHLCRTCQSTDISIQYGKFGYYFKCNVSANLSTPVLLD